MSNNNAFVASDPVNHPSHYLAVAITLEPIELTARLNSCFGQALQYVFRAPHKGSEIEDLRKACFYLHKWFDIYGSERREVIPVEASHFIRIFRSKMTGLNCDVLQALFETSKYTDEKYCEVATPDSVLTAIELIQDQIKRLQAAKLEERA